MDTQLAIFFITSLVVIITPGQDMVLVLSRSISQGSKAGISTAAGVSTGLLGHTLLAALGLGAILQASDILFFIIKIVGAVYLFYLGIKLLRSGKAELKLSEGPPISPKILFFQGAISNLSNPKITIFYFAFLPQFIAVNASNPLAEFLTLGTSFAALTFLIKASIGYGAGSYSKWLRNNPSIQVWINRFSGTVLIALGVRLAFQSKS
ncbi:LysE family translocator [bacterium]|nr:LysE family translocator [bacterium]